MFWCQKSSVILFLLSYLLYIAGVTLPLIHIRGSAPSSVAAAYIPSEFEDQVRTLRGSLEDLWTEGEYVPFFLVIFFSVCVPIVKLVLCMFAVRCGQRAVSQEPEVLSLGSLLLCSPTHSTSGRLSGRGEDEAAVIELQEQIGDQQEAQHAVNTTYDPFGRQAQLRKCLSILRFLRMISKFQLVDAYVVLFMMAFLNENLISTQIKSGARFFLAYCICSICATHLLYLSFSNMRINIPACTPNAVGCDRRSPPECLLEPSSFADARAPSGLGREGKFGWGLPVLRHLHLGLVCITACLFTYALAALSTNKFLRVSVVLDEKTIIIDGHSYTMMEVLNAITSLSGASALASFANSFSAVALLVVFAIIIPCLQMSVLLAYHVLRLTKNTAQSTRLLVMIGDNLSDWAMGDVFALGVFTTYVSLNSIPTIMASIPSVNAKDAVWPSSSGNVSFSLGNNWSTSLPGFWAALLFGVCAFEIQAHIRAMIALDEPFSLTETLSPSMRHDQGPPLPRYRGDDVPSAETTARSASSTSTGELHRETLGPTRRTVFPSTPFEPLPLEGSGIPNKKGTTPDQICPQRHTSLGMWPSAKISTLIVVLKAIGITALGAVAIHWNSARLRGQWDASINLQQMNKKLTMFVRSFNSELSQKLPASFGNCTDFQPDSSMGIPHGYTAPTPCIGADPVYYVRTSTYEALARWFTGLNTAQLHELKLQRLAPPAPNGDDVPAGQNSNATNCESIPCGQNANVTNCQNIPAKRRTDDTNVSLPDGLAAAFPWHWRFKDVWGPISHHFARHEEDAGRGANTDPISDHGSPLPWTSDKIGLSFFLKGALMAPKLSLRVAECISPDVWLSGRCHVLWDNVDSCCGENVSFAIGATVECHDTFPFLRNAQLDALNIDRLTIKERIIFGKQYVFQDITAAVVAQLTDMVNTYALAPSGEAEHSILQWNNRPMVLLDILNQMLFYNHPEGFSCTPPAVPQEGGTIVVK